ncbi:hypothetical protein EGW08_019105 [Elysia chlorotica]|uniref:Uncharacterized protein n=1 Tax=Elysia chlorotica TaxID=188477 RepID=A0A3S1B6A8_ELYCH|nr:hypothetical protein EGW08_019105 [Elysia chlorotica]
MPDDDPVLATLESSTGKSPRRASVPLLSDTEAADGRYSNRSALSPSNKDGPSTPATPVHHKTPSKAVSATKQSPPRAVRLDRVATGLPTQRCETSNYKDGRPPTSRTSPSKSFFGVVLRPASFSGTTSKAWSKEDVLPSSATMFPSTVTKTSPESTSGQHEHSPKEDPPEKDTHVEGQSPDTKHHNGIHMVKNSEEENKGINHEEDESSERNGFEDQQCMNDQHHHQDQQQQPHHHHHTSAQNLQRQQQKHQEQHHAQLYEQTRHHGTEYKKPIYPETPDNECNKQSSPANPDNEDKTPGHPANPANATNPDTECKKPGYPLNPANVANPDIECKKPGNLRRNESLPYDQSVLRKSDSLPLKTGVPSFREAKQLFAVGNHAAVTTGRPRHGSLPDAHTIKVNVRDLVRKMSDASPTRDHQVSVSGASTLHRKLTNGGAQHEIPTADLSSPSPHRSPEGHSVKPCPKWREGIDIPKAAHLCPNSDGARAKSISQTSGQDRSNSSVNQDVDAGLFLASNSQDECGFDAGETLEEHSSIGTARVELGCDDICPEAELEAEGCAKRKHGMDVGGSDHVKDSSKDTNRGSLKKAMAPRGLTQLCIGRQSDQLQSDISKKSNYFRVGREENMKETDQSWNHLESNAESNHQTNGSAEKVQPQKTASVTLSASRDVSHQYSNDGAQQNHHNAVGDLNEAASLNRVNADTESRECCSAAEAGGSSAHTRPPDPCPAAGPSHDAESGARTDHQRGSIVASLVSRFSSGSDPADKQQGGRPQQSVTTNSHRQRNHQHRLSLPLPKLLCHEGKAATGPMARLERSNSLRGPAPGSSGQGHVPDEMSLDEAEIDRLLQRSQELRRLKQRLPRQANMQAVAPETVAVETAALDKISLETKSPETPAPETAALKTAMATGAVKVEGPSGRGTPRCGIVGDISTDQNKLCRNIASTSIASETSHDICQSIPSRDSEANAFTVSSSRPTSSQTVSKSCRSSTPGNKETETVSALKDDVFSNADSSDCASTRGGTLTDTSSRFQASRRAAIPAATKPDKTLKGKAKTCRVPPGDFLLAATKPPLAPAGRKPKPVRELARSNSEAPNVESSGGYEIHSSNFSTNIAKGDGRVRQSVFSESAKSVRPTKKSVPPPRGNHHQGEHPRNVKATHVAQLKCACDNAVESDTSAGLVCENSDLSSDDKECDEVFIRDNKYGSAVSPTQAESIRVDDSASSQASLEINADSQTGEKGDRNTSLSSSGDDDVQKCPAPEGNDAGSQDTMKFSQAERIARYKEDRRRQLAYVSEKIGLELSAAPGVRSSSSSSASSRRSLSAAGEVGGCKADALNTAKQRSERVQNPGRLASKKRQSYPFRKTSGSDSSSGTGGELSDAAKTSAVPGSSSKQRKGSQAGHDCVFKRLSSSAKNSPRCRRAGYEITTRGASQTRSTPQNTRSVGSSDRLKADSACVVHSSLTAAKRWGQSCHSVSTGHGPRDVCGVNRGVFHPPTDKVSASQERQTATADVEAKRNKGSTPSFSRRILGSSTSSPTTSPRSPKSSTPNNSYQERHSPLLNDSSKELIHASRQSPNASSPRNEKS